MNSNERDKLIDDLLDAEISEADFLRLEAEFHADPASRQAYYDRLTLSTHLEVEAREAAMNSKITPVDFRGAFKLWRGIAIAAAIVGLAVASILWQIGDPGRMLTSGEEPTASGFAVLAGTDDAVWSEKIPHLSTGDLIPPGRIQLSSGIAQIDLFSGVTLVVEGDAEFEITSQMEMRLTRGKLRADVPPAAHGFRVTTPNSNVVDLGTEFALDVSDKSSELHVIEGEVEWHPKDANSQNFTTGQAIHSGSTKSTLADPSKFVSARELESKLAQKHADRLKAWNKHVSQFKNDPRLLVYFPMGSPQDGPRTLANQAGDNPDGELNGAIVAADHVPGRFGPGKAALDFSPAGSRVRVSIPGEHGSLTFYCWTKIDSLDRWYNSLFLTDGHELHEPHWQIMDDGRLFFSVKRRDAKNDKHIAYSPSFWNPALGGKWIQIATVYDTGNWTTTHYVNGEAISVDNIPEDMRVESVSIGPASIGNWGEPKRNDPHFAVRNLNGAIDEFAIFSAALSAGEIKKLYEIGKP